MVNELRELLHDNAAHPPHEDRDLGAVLRGGRRRVHRRRLGIAGGTAVAAVSVIGLASVVWPSPPDLTAAGVPAPDAPTLRLADAREAVEGRDYTVLTSYTNEDLDADNGQYLDGVTDDGLVLFRDGPRSEQPWPRYALLDPATGGKDWLPAPDVGQATLEPVDLGEDRLVLAGMAGGGMRADVVAHVFDRGLGAWTTTRWADLPRVEQPGSAVLGPDDRLYVSVPNTQGQPPEGGWPTSPGGEADDADAEGDTYRLWSASLTDPDDVRDEGLTVGDVAFTDTSMVWTDRTNGDSGRVHVRDLATGEEEAFDPRSGARCNLLSFGATADRVVLGQYCGTYDGVRDDRVQVLSTEGDQVVTVQDSDIDGGLGVGSDVVTVTSYQRGGAGTYIYDLANDRFLRVSDDVSSWATGGPTQPDQVLWGTPVNRGHGATQWLGELVRP
ncbi:hypothetical protein [Nocardioides euryhalodurans]|uniref:WD40 repeat domain-containing protein n=1 Tax=Nocardioides euryhalodurans TaxID=2518370 RepID=A0A4V1BDS6_9ACTN|nr:hypothetical protein [Nocardioides euryhalodurans]QBR92152.1 hypothetical protein EXE57_07540 [Nocardioides euryhalodurans]